MYVMELPLATLPHSWASCDYTTWSLHLSFCDDHSWAGIQNLQEESLERSAPPSANSSNAEAKAARAVVAPWYFPALLKQSISSNALHLMKSQELVLQTTDQM